MSEEKDNQSRRHHEIPRLSEGVITELESGSSLRRLLEEAMRMREKAHCPYSNFRVGSAVLSKIGDQMYSGCNVENASYGLSICAERTAICNAVTNGCKQFSAIAVCCDVKGEFKGSCGACRQTMVEFGTDWSLYCVKPDGSYIQVAVSDLLPMGFHPEALLEERV